MMTLFLASVAVLIFAPLLLEALRNGWQNTILVKSLRELELVAATIPSFDVREVRHRYEQRQTEQWTEAVVEVRDLTKVYGRFVAVDHVSFSVGRGEIFGLLGPNGAGKTTTILMLLGLTEISGGEVRVLGFNPGREPLSVKRRVGYLPDTVGFYDGLTAADNLRYTARLIGFRFVEREKRIADALNRVGLSEFAEKHVATFSHGMRQRLGLAEILMKGAQIAILDEPTSGLDPHATAELLDIIRGFKTEGISVLLSSHLLERVQSVCDRVALFNAGRIVLMGSIDQLGRETLGGGYVVDIEADGAGLPERLALIPGVSGVERLGINMYRLHADRDVRPEAAAEVVAMNGRLKFLSVRQPSLEVIYTRYFEEHPSFVSDSVRDVA